MYLTRHIEGRKRTTYRFFVTKNSSFLFVVSKQMGSHMQEEILAWIYLVGFLVHTYILCILIYLTLSQKIDSSHYFDYTSPPKQTKLSKCREHRIKVALILLFSFKKIWFLAKNCREESFYLTINWTKIFDFTSI